MSEMNTSFQHLTHGHFSHNNLLIGLGLHIPLATTEKPRFDAFPAPSYTVTICVRIYKMNVRLPAFAAVICGAFAQERRLYTISALSTQ
jgi:hypothetical protein